MIIRLIHHGLPQKLVKEIIMAKKKEKNNSKAAAKRTSRVSRRDVARKRTAKASARATKPNQTGRTRVLGGSGR